MSGKITGVTRTGLGGASEFAYTYDPADPESVGTSDLLTTGEEVYSRVRFLGSSTMVSGQIRFTYFTCRKSGTSTGVRTVSGSVASSGLTLARLGLYSIAANGDGTRVAVTTSDTTLYNVATTATTKNWAVAYDKVAGQRYALAILTVGTTAGSVYAYTSPTSEVAGPPRIGGSLSAQADLPASFTEASMGISGFMPYGVI